jgi:arylsulfatase A-like enzyme
MNRKYRNISLSKCIGMALAVAVVTALAAATSAALASSDQRPNIVFMIVDDQDFVSLGAYADYAYTPRIDRLAAEGMLFHRAYVTSSACSPSRYAMFTGRVATRGTSDAFHEFHTEGQSGYITNDVVQLELDRPNFVQQLHENGYFTGFIGKWHLGPHRIADLGGRRIPRGQQLGEPHVDAILRENHRLYVEYIRQFGFDFVDRIYWDNIGNWDTHVDGLDAQNLEWKVEGALDFLDQAAQQDSPFLLWFAMVQPHNPSAAVADFPPLPGSERITPIGLLPEDAIPNVMPPRETIEKRIRAAGKPPRPPRRETAQKYGNEYSLWIDDGVGAILDRLEQMGVADNTIVIYMSNNATWGKFHTYELGNNIPQIIRWPGRIAAGSENNHLFSNVDFAPTLLAAAGVDLPGDLGQDGVNQLPSLLRNESVRDIVFLEFGTTRSVSDGVWKYIAIRPTEEDLAFSERIGMPLGHWGEREVERRFIGLANGWRVPHLEMYPGYFDKDQLYNLERDPRERNNLANNPEYRPILERMQSIMSEHIQRKNRPFGEF